MNDKKIKVYSTSGSFRTIYAGVEKFDYNKVWVVIDLYDDEGRQKSLAIHIENWDDIVSFIQRERS